MVEAAEFIDGARDHGLATVRIPDVTGCGHDIEPRIPQTRHLAGEIRVAGQVVEGHPGTAPGKQGCGRQSDAGSRARHETARACKIAADHWAPLRPSMDRASSDVATRQPSMEMMPAAFSTSSALVASTPRSR